MKCRGVWSGGDIGLLRLRFIHWGFFGIGEWGFIEVGGFVYESHGGVRGEMSTVLCARYACRGSFQLVPELVPEQDEIESL